MIAAQDELTDDDVPDGVTLAPYERFKYGVIWSPLYDTLGRMIAASRPDWQIERDMLNAPADAKPVGWKGRAFHLMRFISEVWGTPNDLFWIQWNPNAVEILNRYCEHQILSVAGHASSGKSFVMAALGCAEFLLNPQFTKVLVTSLTKQSSEGRIWGDVKNCWTVASQFFGGNIPGRLLEGKHMIRFELDGVKNTKAGVELLAGEANEVKDSSAKIQGIKAENLVVLGDEWEEMPLAIYNSVMSNLRANPNSRLLAAFNPNLFTGPGGLISRPAKGWHSVTVESSGWATAVGGWCIHFDGEKSPNVLDPRAPWNRILDSRMLEDMRKANPKGTKHDDRMVRGWWSTSGAKQAIYDVADIENYGADQRETKWVGPMIWVAGLDIGNAHGGDKTVLTIGRVGPAKFRRDAAGMDEVHQVCERVETLVLNEDMSLGDSLSEQIVKRVKEELGREVLDAQGRLLRGKVPAENLAVDCTGGGTHFAALLAREIGSGFIMVGFGESASDMRVSKNDKRTGKQAFANKVSELWGVGVQLIRTSQLRNIDPDTVYELTIRTYKDDGSKRMLIESKDDMKKRTNGQSPDRADSYVLFVEAARVRGQLSSSEAAAARVVHPQDLGRLARQVEEFFGGAESVSYGDSGWGED